MIRIAVDPAGLEASVRALDPKWFDKAAKRTERFIAKKRYDETKGIWSRIKAAYVKIQHAKCAYCERLFETPEYGLIEHDVEHFRPKNEVPEWPNGDSDLTVRYDFPTGAAFPGGYYWLAYDTWNYAASCKVCNSRFKLNFFPILGSRGEVPSKFAALSEEQPLLCYPLGTADADPETLVTFDATTAIPAAENGPERRRGQVIIDFFRLNERETLHKGRATMISVVGPSLAAVSEGRDTAVDREVITRGTSAAMPHSACVRAFVRLWDRDEARARAILDLCRLYVVSAVGLPPAVP
jgi:5-methylcytosine-specific restriction endonuclease McrA